MGKAFQILGAILTAIGGIGVLALIFKVGLDASTFGAATTYGIVELILVVGLIFQVLYKVTEGEL